MADKTIYLMRHGETDMNREQRLQGQIDCPLNENGADEARKTAAVLKRAGISFERIYSSPLQRALRTAEIIGNGKTVITEPLIKEMSFGRYEGIRYDDIDKDLQAFIHDPDNVPAPKGVESVRSITSRTGIFLKRIMEDEGKGNILAVAHGIALRSMLWNLCPPEEKSAVWKMPIKNCVIYVCEVRNGLSCGIRRADELSIDPKTDTSKVF